MGLSLMIFFKQPLFGKKTIKPIVLFLSVALATPLFSTAYAKSCKDFSTHQEAQAWYEKRKKSGQTGWKSLDRDGDGYACDCLPGGNGKKCPKKKK